MSEPVVVDLFCGAGGLAEGFRAAGFRVAVGVDFDAAATETFRQNIGGHAICDDAREVSTESIRGLCGERVNVVVGGPSCQGFSTSGGLSKRSGRDLYDPRNSLFTEYVRFVRDLAPDWIVFENVPGLLLYNRGAVARSIIALFAEHGYRVWPMILLAADYGVPQLRRRVIFVGNRTGRPIVFPAPTHGNPDLWSGYALPFAHLSRIGHKNSAAPEAHLTFDDACSDLPSLAEGESIDGVPYPSEAASEYQRLMRCGARTLRQHSAFDLCAADRLAARLLKPGENWRALPAKSRPARFERIRPYDATTLLRRLCGDRPAYTITTKFNEATTGAFIHPRDDRTLSIREAARLQSFPDRYVFAGSGPEIRKQIGNAVPPLFAQAVAEALLPSVLADMGVQASPMREVIAIESDAARDAIGLRAARKKTKQYGPTSQLSLPFG